MLLFNGRDGEWAAHVTALGKRGGTLVCDAQTRQQDHIPRLVLLFAPVKGDRTDYIVEKATELGVALICPMITDRTIVRKPNLERLRARAIEAAEQSGRLSVPEIAAPRNLSSLQDILSGQLDMLTAETTILFADEARNGVTIPQALADKPRQVVLLIGPEGGFTPQERARLLDTDTVIPVSLGPRILRADTAAYAGLTLIQAIWGDWSASGRLAL